MRFVSILRLRLRSIFSRNRVESELDEELRYHLDRQVQEEIRVGRRQDEARFAALREIKNLQQRREECRDMRNISYLEDFAADVRYARRQLLKNRSFFAIAAVALALGIAANTAIFSVVDGVLLRPFPYRQAARLASLWCSSPAQGIPKMGCALPDWHEIAARNHSFEGIANYYYADINITDGRPERVSGVYSSSNLFPLLGVKPALGRTFAPSEEVFGKNHVVVLSDSLWRDRFAGKANAIGEMLRLNGELYTVIGVMPPAFQFPDAGTKLWMPMSFAPNDNMATRDNHFIDAIARLKDGTTVAQSRADVQSIARQLQREFSQDAGLGADTSDYLSSVLGDVRPVLFILLGAVGVLLLIACVNVANLLLARASGRQRELSVRAVLGASRSRLVRQLLSEGVLLGSVGACLGICVSAWLVRMIRIFGPRDIPRLNSVEINAAVLVFTAAITLLSVMLFALAPAIDLARVQVNDALKEGGRSLTASSRTNRFRDTLVVAEITLSLLLVISAGLLMRTLRQLQHVNPGFQPENVLTISVTLPQLKYPETQPAKIIHFFDQLTKRLRQVPGVKAVGASTAMPIASWGGWGKYFTVEEHPAPRLADVPAIQYRQATPGLVKALQIPIQEGRFFTEDDTGARPLVAVINESARRRFFSNQNPIGKQVYPNPPESTITKLLPSPGYRFPRLTIVGVIGDLHQDGLSLPPQPELWVPYLQGTAKGNETPDNKMFVFIRTESDPLRFAGIARGIVQSLDPEQPVADVATMEQRLKTSLSVQRFQLNLFAGFAIVALVLAAVGIYGVLSYSVRLRMHEIGIRMALGAATSDVLEMVVKHGLGLWLIGVVLGSCLALGITRFMASLLFGVQANDGLTFFSASLILLVVLAAASLAPCIRATRTDALAVLRAE